MRKLVWLASAMCLSTSVLLADISALSSFEGIANLFDQEISEIQEDAVSADSFLSHCRHRRCSSIGRGPTGPTGPTGATGSQGIPGFPGTIGPAGPLGGTGGNLIFSPQAGSESGNGLGVTGGNVPILYNLGAGNSVASQIVSQGGTLVTNSSLGGVTYNSNGTLLIAEPGYYLVTYGVVPSTGTANTILSLRSTLTGNFDIPGSLMNPAPTSSMQTIQTIYFSPGGGDGLQVIVNSSPTAPALLTLGSPTPNLDVVFFLNAIRISE